MAFARTRSVTLLGVDGVVIEVQADIEPGLAVFNLVGLPDRSVSESRDRVRAALVNSGEEWPPRRITVGLSPATVPKSGSGFDLAVACAVVAANGALDPERLAELIMVGEVGLDGRVRPVRGILPSVMAAAAAGCRRVVVPESVAVEARLVPDITVLGVRSLRHLFAVLRGLPEPDEPGGDEAYGPDPETVGPMLVSGPGVPGAAGPDLAEIAGQARARRALEVCAAGGHHLYLLGPPGAGKTMLAERLPGLLPPLEPAAALEVSAVHSVAGTLPPDQPLVTAPPFCAPHHSATMPSLVGGGNGLPRPGAVSLAHHGVLFLDEAPEFSTRALDALRQPLEGGTVTVARSAGTLRFPARFLLVLAANPCPCGRFAGKGMDCTCSPVMRAKYLARLSGPLLDRIDVRVTVDPVSRAELLEPAGTGESTDVVAARVHEARARAHARYADTPWTMNAEVPGRELRTRWSTDPDALASAARDLERGILTARGLDRVLRVAWTIADLRGHDRPALADVDAALEFRTGVRRGADTTIGLSRKHVPDATETALAQLATLDTDRERRDRYEYDDEELP
ncbi:YifB family Mg chelatase-like AAA ATPase [Yinghuangia seranimata]|uniref:YifB family Mg chelatase-like AAA ATPase n=1 Tax=Yinghuangia seranimata TaxID=408067 RepID=UPI00248C1EC8|nr:YifB family Mg chelatase-like AAA ATPase [Yinghuangia seranimata]MDI2129263.1 YifB family Mg chelatase-like AAA ATPase [Yinghuangia seranimata]